MGAGCPPLTGHCSGRVLRDARTGVRLLTCSVPVGVPLAGLRAKQFEELADELFGCFFGHVVTTVDHRAA